MVDQQLLNRCLRYFLKHGVANLSLRPMGNAIGVSARMLVHHFGSKEELIVKVMEEVRGRFQDLLKEVAQQEPRDAADVMLAFWGRATSPHHLPYLRLLLEVQVLAAQNPAKYARYLHATSLTWLDLIETQMPAGKSRRVFATLCTAVIDGLLIELISTNDRERARRALELFGKLIR